MKTIIFLSLLLLAGCGDFHRVNGKDGAPGVNGTNGKDGKDATPVTVVQLCPGVTTYPSTFVEVAFCVGGKLYAVYSNGAFATEIPPGVYNSNGAGNSCTVVVEENCVVHQ